MWKRISAFFVLSVFLLSLLPMAFAVGNVDAGPESREQAQVEVRAPGEVGPQVEVRTEAGEDINTSGTPAVMPRVQLREKLQERAEEIKQNIVAARLKYADAKQHYIEVREQYRDNQGKFLEVRKDSLDCADLETEECKAKREEARVMAKDYLLKTADLILGELERVRAKILESELVTEDEKTGVIADLDASIEEVTGVKATIEGLADDASREDINAAAKSLRVAWQNARPIAKKEMGISVNDKLGNIVLRAEQLEETLKELSARLAEKGEDTSKLDATLEMYNEKIALAKEKYEEAKAKWSAAHSPKEVDAAANEFDTLLSEAKEALKDTRAILRDAVQEIKSLNRGQLEVESGETAEASA